ncbi:MAG: hypothetical protein E7219_06610 [Clostridiales bacterium]|nr:hypothetical protein [Clostridiales bacterium]
MTDTGCSLTRKIKVLPSMCDGGSRLSVAAALDMFQDTATMHADLFDIGPAGMERRRSFWIITKTRINISRMPKMMDEVSVSTWIQAAERVSCERDFSINDGGETLAYGRSIWAVISRESGRLSHLDTMYPNIDFDIAPPDDRPFLKIGRKFDDADVIGEYTVRSVDIDLGGHMNNVNYVRAMLGCFTSEQLTEMQIREIEVNYISQTFEGENLIFKCRHTASGLEIGAVDKDGKAHFTAAISTDAKL